MQIEELKYFITDYHSFNKNSVIVNYLTALQSARDYKSLVNSESSLKRTVKQYLLNVNLITLKYFKYAFTRINPRYYSN
jgi:hypothetical protein